MLIVFVRRLVAATADEAGAVLIVFAVFASGAIALAAYVIDVGNWFDHHRHLQLQADAGAFAAGQTLAQLLNSGCTAANKAAIYEEVARYAGATSVATPEGSTLLKVKSPTAPAQGEPYNAQVGGTPQGRVHAEVNLKKYYGEQSQEDKTVVEKAPCDPEADMVDVKVTETNLPWFFQVVGSALHVVPYINAHARVAISGDNPPPGGLQPLAVQQTAPAGAKAYFVNEDEGNTVLRESTLKGSSNGQEFKSEAPVGLEIKKTTTSGAAAAHIGVVIALSGQPSTPTVAGTLAEKCNQAFVRCFDQTTTGPLLHIAGYSHEGIGTPTAPLAREVKLELPGKTEEPCTDPYFSTSTTSCKVRVAAEIDYGKESGNEKGITVTAQVGAAAAATLKLEGGVWKGNAAVTPETGLNQVTLVYTCKKKTGPCGETETTAPFKNAQAIFASSRAHAGPIASAVIEETGPEKLTQDADTFEICEGQEKTQEEKKEGRCQPNLAVTVHTEPSLADAATCSVEAECKTNKAGFYDELHRLKFEGNKGTIDACQPNSTSEFSTTALAEHIKEGCPDAYKANEFTGSGSFTDPECTSGTPYDCIGVGGKGEHNGARGAVGEHFETPYPAGTKWECHNWWQNNNKGGIPIIPSNDSRLIQVFIVPFGALDEEGVPRARESIPIEHFATFYVTGFYGDGCKLTTKEKEEGFVPDDKPTTTKGKEGFEIVGHFIKYVSVVGESNGSKCKTEATALETCVVTLTE